MRWTESGTERALAGLLLGAVAWTGALAQPVDPPLPPPRPNAPAAAEPLPPPRPNRPATPESAPNASPRAEPDRIEAGRKETAEERGGNRDSSCPERLARMGVRFEERPPVRDEACSVDDAVLVTALPDGVEVKPPSLMTCALAEGLAQWMRDTVAVESDRLLQADPTGVLIGTSYQCRSQRSGSKLSEHAFGNGVDIMGFEFARRGPIGVAQHEDGTPESAFRAAVQKGACAHFTTVLGPGSDAAHGDHLHLDMRGRRGGYRICQ